MPSPKTLPLCATMLLCAGVGQTPASAARLAAPLAQEGPSKEKIAAAFGRQGFTINNAEATGILANVRLAINEARAHGLGNSKVDFAAVEIAHDLGVGTDAATIKRVVAAIGELSKHAAPGPRVKPRPPGGSLPPRPADSVDGLSWEKYFDETLDLWNNPGFMSLLGKNGFFPVKISWEDIGRHKGSVWGDRISDVGIWVRRQEDDPASARLALSVRRDSNYRDKVLMVPAEKIKVHVKQGKKTIEKTLPQRLGELGLASPERDRNVIVSNQFAILPVPGHGMAGTGTQVAPPRAAFNFSIFPYGSTNYVITDVIEGSSEAIVGPGRHQLLYADVGGQKAPFTASRAEDRQDLLRLEADLRSKGMDVDVQRYYLIQVPLRRDAGNISLSNMGEPPRRGPVHPVEYSCAYAAPVPSKSYATKVPMAEMVPDEAPDVLPINRRRESLTEIERARQGDEGPGLGRVAIGHGQSEGRYSPGSGFRGARADEPIRVTVVYFVTPTGKVGAADMALFAQTFGQWDSRAIWGGSFVTKE